MKMESELNKLILALDKTKETYDEFEKRYQKELTELFESEKNSNKEKTIEENENDYDMNEHREIHR